MTSINTNRVNFKNFKKESYSEKFIIFLFSFLPISFILGNSAINLNIIIIGLFFLLTCYRQKQWSWIRNKYFYFFIFIWIYLVINSIISENVAVSLFDPIRKEIVYPKYDSIIRSVGFIRFIIFLFAVQYFFFNSKKIFNQIFLYWSVIIFIVLIDVVFERIIGFNLFGFESPTSKRIVSFFKDELVVGGFILSFSFLISGFLLQLTKNDTVKKILPSIFFCLSIICIYLTGERSNFVKALITVSIILLLIKDAYFYIKKKYIFLLIIIGIALSTLIYEDVYVRQIQFFKRIQLYDQGSIYDRFGHIKHFAHYDTAWKIFKDYPIFGVGNLKFRYICHNKEYFNDEINYTNQRCSTHPHQIHLEILSEQGIIGYSMIISTILYILFNSFKIYRKTGDLIHLSSILFVLTFLIPLLPTGSFFSTFTGTIFWINFSFTHAFLTKPKK
jgi:O-antigen ligase